MNFKINQLAFPALLLLSNDVLVRIAIQGFKQGLLSAVVEWFAKRRGTNTASRPRTGSAKRDNEVSNAIR